MDLTKILNALFTSLNSHVDKGFASMVKALGSAKLVSTAINEQTKALTILFTDFQKSLKKIENPKIEVSFDKALDAQTQALKKHLGDVHTSIQKIENSKIDADVRGAVTNLTTSLKPLFEGFYTALSKIENPKISVAVEMAPVQKQIDDILALLKKKQEFSITPLYDELKEIKKALKDNKPEKLGERFDVLDQIFKGLKPKETVKFDDAQITALIAAMRYGGGVTTNGSVKSATRYLVDTLTLTNANTEYTFTFPANVVSWTMKMRVAGSTVFYSHATGKFPTTGDNTDYMTLLPMGARSQDNVEWGGVKMFFQSDTAGDVVEFELFQL